MTIKRFEELDVWKLARVFAMEMYQLTSEENFSRDLRFRDQLRSSARSVMDNIAEGFERDGKKEFIQFLFIAKGSIGESRSQLYHAFDVGYLNKEEFSKYYEKAEKISQSLSNFIKYLKQTEYKGTKYKS